jgi:hypothetical protein
MPKAVKFATDNWATAKLEPRIRDFANRPPAFARSKHADLASNGIWVNGSGGLGKNGNLLKLRNRNMPSGKEPKDELNTARNRTIAPAPAPDVSHTDVEEAGDTVLRETSKHRAEIARRA